MKMELGVPEGGDAERETSPMPHGGTLDLDLMISRLLSYKDDPGKQAWPIFIVKPCTNTCTAVFKQPQGS